MDPNDYVFRRRNGETLIKPPGSINGNGFVLDTLHDCEVYLLDHTSQVQIDDCVNCKIFIGPTDGSIFVRDCRDCTLCVASRQLRTRDCKDLDIALYCATQPSIETSTGIVFSCWRGAYPGLTEHFHKARLDPTKNTWRQVYDFNRTEDLGAPHFQLDESVRPWWTAPAGEGAAAECPVPAADGSLYGGGCLPPEPANPKGSPGALKLPESLPPSPGRAAAYDEEVELDDDEPPTILPPGVEDGGRSFVAPAQPSPRTELPSQQGGSAAHAAGLGPLPLQQAVLDDSAAAAGAGASGFTFDSPRTNPGAGFGAVLFGSALADGGNDGGGGGSGGGVQDGSNPVDDFPAPAAAPPTLPPPWGAQAAPTAAASAPVVTVTSAAAPPAPAPPPPALPEDFFSMATPLVAVDPAEALPPQPQPRAVEDMNATFIGVSAAPGKVDAPAAGSLAAGPEALTGSEAAAAAAAAAAEPVVTDAESVPANGDARVAWRVANAKKLSQMTAQEGQAKAALQAEARRKLEAMQQTREARLKQRFATNRAHQQLKAGGPAAGGGGAAAATAAGGSPRGGGGVWERVAELVDLTGSGGAASGNAGRATAPPGRDMTRLRQLIISLKAKHK